MSQRRKRARSDSSASQEDPRDARDDDTELTERAAGTVLALVNRQQKLAATYFDAARDVLFVLEDTQDNDKHDLAAMIVEQVRPSTVLTSSKSDAVFIERIKEVMEPMQDESADELTIVLRPQGEWTPPAGLRSLQMLRVHDADVADGDDNAGRDLMAIDNHIRLGSFLSLNTQACPVLLGAVACLFSHFRRSPTPGELPNPDGLTSVTSVQRIPIHKMLHLNASALDSLQIFANEAHANVYSERVKEGLSVFGVLNRTRTPAGKLILRQWLMRPSTELKVITARQDAIECFLAPENDAAVKDARKGMKGVKNLVTVLKALQEGRGKHVHWLAVFRTICAAIEIRQAFVMLDKKQEVPVVERFLSCFNVDSLQTFGVLLNDTIDWEESKAKGRISIKPHVDAELDEYRHDLAALPSKLDHIAHKLSASIPPDFAESLNVSYFPQLGFLIATPYTPDWQNPADHMPDPSWTFQFSTELSTYWKNDQMRELDEHFGDLDTLIASREIDLAHELYMVLEEKHASVLRVVHDHIAELDCLFALAEVAKVHNWVRPVVTTENVCRIQGGRHPLVECCVSQYVANDTSLVAGRNDQKREDGDQSAADERSVLVLTGANGSGKSVYLKTVALITFLAHCGSFVPADSAEIGLTDAIFTRVSTKESASHSASAFTIDLQQISYMLRNCTNRSLLIIDEFGKGTETSDGEALFAGLLEHLVKLGEDTPKTLLATHFHTLFATEVIEPSLPIVRAHMKLLVQDDDSTVTHLFRLASGLTTTSHACQCASANGISSTITDRARYVSSLLSRHAISELLDAALTDDEVAEMEACADRVRRFLDLDLDAPEADDILHALGQILEG